VVDGLPFWQSFLICLSGGVLGCAVHHPAPARARHAPPTSRIPEGVAAAEVLKVGSGTRGETRTTPGEAREGLRAVVLGSVASAGLAIVTATRDRGGGRRGFVRLGRRGRRPATTSRGRSPCSARAPRRARPSAWRCSSGQIISWVIAVPS
jgi:hypothetical protein